MSKQPKVLVACPTYKGKDYCIEEWMELIKNLAYHNYDIFIVDNTNDDGEHAKWIADKFGVETQHHFHSDVPLNELMMECNEIIRKKALENDYDYLMSIESDVFPPSNVIPKLINAGNLITSGIYKIGFPSNNGPYPLLQIVTPGGPKDENGKSTMNIRQMHWYEISQFLDGTVKPIHGCGIGCSLIRKELLEKFPFRIVKGEPVHADSYFYMDLHNAGIQAYVHTGIMCKHKNRDWRLVYEERSEDFDVNFKFKIGGKDGKEKGN